MVIGVCILVFYLAVWQHFIILFAAGFIFAVDLLGWLIIKAEERNLSEGYPLGTTASSKATIQQLEQLVSQFLDEENYRYTREASKWTGIEYRLELEDLQIGFIDLYPDKSKTPPSDIISNIRITYRPKDFVTARKIQHGIDRTLAKQKMIKPATKKGAHLIAVPRDQYPGEVG